MECGNTTVATQTVEAFDNVPPVFTFVPGGILLCLVMVAQLTRLKLQKRLMNVQM